MHQPQIPVTQHHQYLQQSPSPPIRTYSNDKMVMRNPTQMNRNNNQQSVYAINEYTNNSNNIRRVTPPQTATIQNKGYRYSPQTVASTQFQSDNYYNINPHQIHQNISLRRQYSYNDINHHHNYNNHHFINHNCNSYYNQHEYYQSQLNYHQQQQNNYHPQQQNNYHQPYQLVNNNNFMDHSGYFNNTQQIYFHQQQQQQNTVVHYDNQYDQQQEHYQQEIIQQQKTPVQILIEEIHTINIEINTYLQYNNQQQKHHTIELIQRINLLQQVLKQNYKIYQINPHLQQQTHHINNKNNNNVYRNKNTFLQSLYGGKINNVYDKNSHLRNFMNATIIDYQQQFSKYKKIINHFNDGSKISNTKQQINLVVNNNNRYSSEYCLNIFINLIIRIQQFYHLNYELKKQTHQSIFQQNHQQQKHRQQLPLLITTIIWHIQALRVLICAYQHELAHIIRSNSYIIKQKNKNNQQLTPTLTNIKQQSILIITKIQQLLGTFLQQIMLQQQFQSNHNKMQQETLSYFYYQYQQFNQQWICLLMDTILKYQMVQGMGSQQIIEVISNKNINGNNKTQKSGDNNNKKSKKLINPIRQKQYQNNNNKQNNDNYLLQQTINNILSILSFLLFPHNHHQNKQQHQQQQSTLILQLLQQPVKKMIVKQMRQYQQLVQKYINQDMDNNDDNKQLLITKFLIVNKITNIVSFFTQKLTQSIKSNIQTKHKYNHNHNKKQKQEVKSQLNCNNEPQYNSQVINKRNGTSNNKLSIQLKIMQMTLFVRQMCDLLICDGIRELQQIRNDQQQKGILDEVLIWIQRLSIKSMIGMLFDKVLRRKQLTK